MTLELIVSNDIAGEKFQTDTLIESIFCFLSKYLGNTVSSDDVYYTGVKILEDMAYSKYFITTPLFIFDENLSSKKINIEKVKVKQKDVLLGGNMITKVNNLVEIYKERSIHNEDIPELSSQEIFTYSSYLLGEQFLKHLEGSPTSFKFPSIIDILNRNDLDKNVREALMYPRDLVFLPNHSDDVSFSCGIYNR